MSLACLLACAHAAKRWSRARNRGSCLTFPSLRQTASSGFLLGAPRSATLAMPTVFCRTMHLFAMRFIQGSWIFPAMAPPPKGTAEEQQNGHCCSGVGTRSCTWRHGRQLFLHGYRHSRGRGRKSRRGRRVVIFSRADAMSSRACSAPIRGEEGRGAQASRFADAPLPSEAERADGPHELQSRGNNVAEFSARQCERRMTKEEKGHYLQMRVYRRHHSRRGRALPRGSSLWASTSSPSRTCTSM